MTDAERARALHDRAIIIDAHNDTLVERLAAGEDLDLTPIDERYDFDVTRALRGGMTCSFFMAGSSGLDRAMALFDAMWWLAETHPDLLRFATCAADIERAKAEGTHAMVAQLESCSCLNQSLATLRNLHRLGLRVANLTHGEGGEGTTQQTKSPFEFCTPADREEARRGPGLTDFGRAVIAECNRLGIVVDLAHSSDAAFYEALELCSTPPIFSHGGVFAQSPHWRGLTDDQLRAFAAVGGVMGVAFHPRFIDPEAPTLERLIDSVEYVINLVGPEHIGFGADFDGMGSLEPIPPSADRVPDFTEALVRRGFDDETVLAVLGGNFLRVLRDVAG